MKRVPKRTSRIALLATVGILAYASVYCVLFAAGSTHLGDDGWYSFLAHGVASGTFMQNVHDVFSVRILHVIPIGAMYKIFGYSVLSSSAWDIISFLMTIILTFLIGKELCNEYVGAIAALLITFFPMVGILAVTMSDNLPMMFFASLSLFALLRASKSHSKKWYFATGVTLILAPLTTPEGFIVWIIAAFFIINELLRGKQKLDRRMRYLPFGLAIALVALMAFNYLNSGSPLITFQAVSRFYSITGTPATIPYANTDLMFYPRIMFPYNVLGILTSNIEKLNFNLSSIFGQIYNPYGMSGVYFYAFVAAAAYLAIKKDKRVLFAMGWFIFGFFYLEFGPMHISIIPFNYQLSHRIDRFLLLIAVPLCIVIAAALEHFAKDSKKRGRNTRVAATCFFVMLILATSIPIILFWHGIVLSEAYSQSSIAQYLNPAPNSTKVYFGWDSGDLLMYMHFQNMSRFGLQYNGVTHCNDIPVGSYVVILKYPRPSVLLAPDPSKCANWKLVLDPSQNENMLLAAYQRSEFYQTVLYHVT